jgi:hypothetical protein
MTFLELGRSEDEKEKGFSPGLWLLTRKTSKVVTDVCTFFLFRISPQTKQVPPPFPPRFPSGQGYRGLGVLTYECASSNRAGSSR